MHHIIRIHVSMNYNAMSKLCDPILISQFLAPFMHNQYLSLSSINLQDIYVCYKEYPTRIIEETESSFKCSSAYCTISACL